MKSLETVLSILGWIVVGIIVWAIAPFLLRMMEMAQHFHDIFR